MRLAVSSDAATLTALAYAAKASHGYPEDWMDMWRKELEITPTMISELHCIVAESNGECVGMAVGDVRRAPEGQLEHMWIRPDMHGRGVGGQLFEAVTQWCALQGCRTVRIESDPGAARFYEKQGAVRAGSVPAPMPGALDRVLPVLVWKPRPIPAST